MKKPSPLQTALLKSGASLAANQPEAPATAPAVALVADTPAATSAAARPRAAKPPQPSRKSTVPITVHFPPEVRRQVKMLAVEQDRKMDDLIAEALNLMFVKYRKPELAPRKSGTAP